MTVREWITQHADNFDSRDGMIEHCCDALGCQRKAVVKQLRRPEFANLFAQQPAPAVHSEETLPTGISLQGVRVLPKSPSNSARLLIQRLPKTDTAFPVTQLAESWGISENTIAEHARKLDCQRYVEHPPNSGEWIKCILNPEIAKQHRG